MSDKARELAEKIAAKIIEETFDSNYNRITVEEVTEWFLPLICEAVRPLVEAAERVRYLDDRDTPLYPEWRQDWREAITKLRSALEGWK